MKKLTLFFLILLSSFYLYSQTWSALTRLTWNSSQSYYPFIAVDGADNLHIAWRDDMISGQEIYYKQSTDGGTNWSALKQLTWMLGPSSDPVIGSDSSNTIYVIWHHVYVENYDIYIKNSTDGGVNWSVTKRLTWNAGDSRYPCFVIDSMDILHVIWSDDTPGNSEIFYKQSQDGGATWSKLIRLTWNSGQSYDPSLAVDSNDTLHLVWEDNSSGGKEIYYRQGELNGKNWSAPTRLTWNSGDSVQPFVAVDTACNPYVGWCDFSPGNYEIYVKGSTDKGLSWSAPKRLTWNSGFSRQPKIVTEKNHILNIVWNDDTPGPFQLYYKQSTDDGATWTAPKRLTWGSSGSHQMISMDSKGALHVVWQNLCYAQYEIYYRNRQ